MIYDIEENEVRIISSEGEEPPKRQKSRTFYVVLSLIGLAIVCGVVALVILFFSRDDERILQIQEMKQQPASTSLVRSDSLRYSSAYVTKRDTVVAHAKLMMLTPCRAIPSLEIGRELLGDSTVLLAVQAAGVREDNGTIVGAFVVKGELISKGEAKAGFCSIVNDKITIGTADATSCLEQALTSDGYFFRQYPLIVGRQPVDNRTKGRALRKALVEMEGMIHVVMSKERLTFQQFSQALEELGVDNAIYLVGADALGFYRDRQGKTKMFGSTSSLKSEHVNFLVWR